MKGFCAFCCVFITALSGSSLHADDRFDEMAHRSDASIVDLRAIFLPDGTIHTKVIARSVTSFAGTHAGQVRDINGLALVWIPPGEFTMGSPKDEKQRGDDENQVEVTITKGFWLGQQEVTQAEWKRVMQTTPWIGKERVKQGDNYPAMNLSWVDAMKFCEKLTEEELSAGRLPSGWHYTLPTEAQWEFACRAGTRSRFSFGDNEGDLPEYAWFYKNTYEADGKYAQLVSQKKPNPWGLYDMHGNGSEWCRDWYAKKLAGGADPQGPSTGSYRVYRGGNCFNSAEGCRSAHRSTYRPVLRFGSLGIRVAVVSSGR
jgi:formylglycine-generating enzyme required for sulfatase activity